jgi:ABC-type transport system involved in multi-copper enzyme maturation permease subunit
VTGWRERLPLIWAIVWKDAVRTRVAFVVILIVAVVIALLLMPLAISVARFSADRFRWNDTFLRVVYALSAIISSLTLALAFYTVHSGEVHKGTMRSIILYPVDANDIAIAKLGSTLLVSFGVSTFLFLGALMPFFLTRVWPFPDFLAVHLMTFGSGFASLATGVFFAHVVARYLGRSVLSPAGWGALCLLLSVVFTEFALNGIGFWALTLVSETRDRPPSTEEFLALADLARTLSVLSPHHWGAHLLSLGFAIFRPGIEIFILIPAAIAVLAVAGGYTIGKKLYLDVFIQ